MKAISKRTHKVKEILDSLDASYVGIAVHLRVYAFTSFVYMTAQAMVIELELVGDSNEIPWDTVIYEIILEHMTLNMQISEDGISYNPEYFRIGTPNNYELVQELLTISNSSESAATIHYKLGNMVEAIACEEPATIRAFATLAEQVGNIIDNNAVYSEGYVLFNNIIHGPHARTMFSVTVVIPK